MNFEEHVKQEVLRIRKVLGEADLPNFRLDIEATGQSLTGDVRIIFKLGEMYSDAVAGNSIDAVIAEFLRRKDWGKRNAPICIGYAERPEVDVQF